MEGEKKAEKDKERKIAIVTGANSGIGWSTAKILYEKGFSVVLTCRSKEKGEEAIEKIKSAISKDSTPGELAVILLDLADLGSIPTFVKEFKEKFRQLHILINNAATFPVSYEVTKQDFESSFGVNHLGPFYLTLLLVDMVAQSSGRIVNVASQGQKAVDFDDLTNLQWMEKRKYKVGDRLSLMDTIDVYARSKSCNVMFTKELSERVKDWNFDVITHSCHPGVVDTGMVRRGTEKSSWLGKKVMDIGRTLMKTPKEGSKCSVFLAIEDLPAKSKNGQFWEGCKISTPTVKANLETANTKRLWEDSVKLLKDLGHEVPNFPCYQRRSTLKTEETSTSTADKIQSFVSCSPDVVCQ